MDNQIQLNVGGIKCDNEACDFVDLSVNLHDYPQWLNKACPKCGDNLLTEEDFQSVQLLLQLVDQMNDALPPSNPNEEKAFGTIHMDGTGKVDVLLETEEEHKKRKH